MKRVLIVLLGLIAVLGTALTIVAARFEPTIQANTFVGPVDVGGLTETDASRKLRVWWQGERLKKLIPTSDQLVKPLAAMTPGQLGVMLDDVASVQDLPMTDIAQAVGVGGSDEKKTFELKFKSNGQSLDGIRKTVKAAAKPARPAMVFFESGQIVRKPESNAVELDEQALLGVVQSAILGNEDSFNLPMKEAPKKLPDAELAKISEVVSEFSTTFPSYQTSRNTNIRLAASKLDGHVLMPGEQISFNKTVGQRTVAGGYKEAPVLKNGKHDTGIGGGICQVSTTLYNASLLADLKIVRRQNHSLPSAYVPVGRDATVDWPSLDLVLENNQDKPIAISSTYAKGKITFRILGQKDPGLSVKIVTSNHTSWSRGEQLVVDRSLKPGTRRVVEKGSSAHAVDVYRVVLKDGVEVRRDKLGRSTYAGCPRTIAYNPAAPAAKPDQVAAAVGN